MIRLQTESKPPPQPFIGVVYRGLCLFRGGNPQNPTMARAGVTYHDVAKAAEAIKSRHQEPTVDRVREHLGTGSKST
ncbi:DNA-binding protein, partial [Alteromonas macleodii]|uniref:DNA-binding protein n=1 Tax=Alteromonas macleodii TaxID=28108 RepID=UPI003466064C